MESNFRLMVRDGRINFRAPQGLIDEYQKIAEAEIRTLSTIMIFTLSEWLENRQNNQKAEEQA